MAVVLVASITCACQHVLPSSPSFCRLLGWFAGAAYDEVAPPAKFEPPGLALEDAVCECDCPREVEIRVVEKELLVEREILVHSYPTLLGLLVFFLLGFCVGRLCSASCQRREAARSRRIILQQ